MAHFHLSWHQLHWGIRWPHIQKMLADGPGYQPAKKDKADGKKGRTVPLFYDDADDLNDFVKGLD